MAITSSGGIVVGLGYATDTRTVSEMIKIISTTPLKPGERLFVGVVLHGRHREEALVRIDDGAAEAAVWSGAGVRGRRSKRGRGQR
jgi:hypothetical protein